MDNVYNNGQPSQPGQQNYAPTGQQNFGQPPMQQMPMQDPSATYGTQLGGVLLAAKICAIIGAVGCFISVPFLLVGAFTVNSADRLTSSFFGVESVTGWFPVVNLVMTAIIGIVAGIALIIFQNKLSKRDSKAFDLLMTGLVISFVAFILQSVLQFIWESQMSSRSVSIWYRLPEPNPVVLALGIIWPLAVFYGWSCAYVAYFSKSKRVLAWFGGRPAMHSKSYPLLFKNTPVRIMERKRSATGDVPANASATAAKRRIPATTPTIPATATYTTTATTTLSSATIPA